MRLAKLLLLLKKSFMLLHTLLIRLFFFLFLNYLWYKQFNIIKARTPNDLSKTGGLQKNI